MTILLLVVTKVVYCRIAPLGSMMLRTMVKLTPVCSIPIPPNHIAETAFERLWGFFGLCFWPGNLWDTNSSSSWTFSWSLKFCAFVGLPVRLGPAPLCFIFLLDLAVLWTGIHPEFFLLPFFTACTTSLPKVKRAFWIDESFPIMIISAIFTNAFIDFR